MFYKAPFSVALARALIAIFTISLPAGAFSGQYQSYQIKSEPLRQMTADQPDSKPMMPVNNDDKIRIAILLPLSGPQEAIGTALLDAASLALMDAYDERILLLPFDTKGKPEDARQAAGSAVEAGAQIVLGPLLADNVRVVGPIVSEAGLLLLGFSNDRTVATSKRFMMGFQPEDEVRRIISYASTGQTASKSGPKSVPEYGSESGITFAGLFPYSLYGDRVQAAFGQAVESVGGNINAMGRYELNAEALYDPVRTLADYDRRKKYRDDEVAYLESLNDDMTDQIAKSIEPYETITPAPFDALLIPEGGNLLQTLAPLLPFYEIDPADVQFLGTGLMNDSRIVNEPALRGAKFAAPDPETSGKLLDRLQVITGERPSLLVTAAYDAMSLVAWLVRQEGGVSNLYRDDLFTDPAGFSGVTGLFRFSPDGLIERALAVVEIRRGGMRLIDPVPSQFQGLMIDERVTTSPVAGGEADSSAAASLLPLDEDNRDRRSDDPIPLDQQPR